MLSKYSVPYCSGIAMPNSMMEEEEEEEEAEKSQEPMTLANQVSYAIYKKAYGIVCTNHYIECVLWAWWSIV